MELNDVYKLLKGTKYSILLNKSIFTSRVKFDINGDIFVMNDYESIIKHELYVGLLREFEKLDSMSIRCEKSYALNTVEYSSEVFMIDRDKFKELLEAFIYFTPDDVINRIKKGNYDNNKEIKG